MIDPISTGGARRVTLTDVAREAGLSVPTVDRVLNGRAPVRPETAKRVHDAAAKLGFHAARLLSQQLEAMRPMHRLGFLLQRRGSEFYRNLAAALDRSARDPARGRHLPVVEHMEDLTPAAVALRIVRMAVRCDAVAVVAADHPKIREAVGQVSEVGCPVFTMLSDLGATERAGYFGIDHRKAGRTAGWAMARLARPGGDLAILLGNHRYLGHELCEISFRAFLREHAPRFRLLEPAVSFEDKHFAYEATLDLFRRSPQLAGLYVPGGGIEGVVEALRERTTPERTVVVASDLFGTTRAGLLEGLIDLVIATPLPLLADRLVDAMLAQLDGLPPDPHPTDLPFEIYLSENV